MSDASFCIGHIENSTTPEGQLTHSAVELSLTQARGNALPVCQLFLSSSGTLAQVIAKMDDLTLRRVIPTESSSSAISCSSLSDCETQGWIAPVDERTLASVIPLLEGRKDVLVSHRSAGYDINDRLNEIRMRPSLTDQLLTIENFVMKTLRLKSFSYIMDLKYSSFVNNRSPCVYLSSNRVSEIQNILAAALGSSTPVGQKKLVSSDTVIVMVDKQMATSLLAAAKSLGMINSERKWFFTSSSQVSDLWANFNALNIPADVVFGLDFASNITSPLVEKLNTNQYVSKDILLAYDSATVLSQYSQKSKLIENQNKNLSEILSTISFTGMTGSVSFSSNGERKIGNSVILKWNGTAMEVIAELGSNGTIQIDKPLIVQKVLKVGFLLDLVNPNSSLILGLVPYSLAEYYFDKLNNESYIPGYKVKPLLMDCLLSSSLATESAYAIMNEGVVSTVGGTLSSQALQEALVLGRYKIPFGVFSAGTDTLSDRTNYPTLVRVKPVDSLQSQAMVGICNAFGWKKRIAAIGVANDYGLNGLNAVIAAAKQYDMTILTTQVFISGLSVSTHIAALKSSGAKVFLLFSPYGTDTITVMNEAYKQGILGPGYIWLSSDAFDVMRQYDWTHQPFYEHFTGTFSVAVSSLQLDPVKKFISNIKTLDPKKYRGLGPNYYPIATFDLLFWDLISLMGNTFRSMALSGQDIYNTSLLSTNMQSSEFEGLTGWISFDSKMNRKYAQYILLDWIDKVPIEVGLYDTLSKNFTLKKEAIIFPDRTSNIPDMDADSREIDYVESSDVEAIIFYTIASIFIFLVFGVMIFVVKNRKTRVIKSSNFLFNMLILLGIQFGYIIIYVFGAEPTRSICNVRPWIAVVSFVLIYGSLFAKTLKIWIIFETYPSGHVVQLPDKIFVLCVALLFGLFSTIIIVWQALDPLTVSDFGENFDNETKRSKICTSDHSDIYIIVLFSIAGLIMALGTFVTFKVRNAQFQNLDLGDAKPIGLSIYNFVLCSTITIPIVIVLRKSPSVQYIILCLGVIFAMTGSCLFLFVPKIIKIVHADKSQETAPSNTKSFSSSHQT